MNSAPFTSFRGLVGLVVIATATLIPQKVGAQQPTKQNKLNTLPADDHTLMRLMKIYSPPILNGGEQMRFPKLKQHLTGKKVVLVGEIHNQFEQHVVQLGILKNLHEQNSKLGIGVEWIESQYQPIVDQYLKGEISEQDLIIKTQFNERWGYDYRMFRPILSFAKQRGIPVFALNAPREVTKKISKHGMQSLTAEEKSLIAPTIHKGSEENLMMLEEHFSLYVTDVNKIERMVQVNRVWDATMSFNTLQALETPDIEQMIVFTGINHIIKSYCQIWCMPLKN